MEFTTSNDVMSEMIILFKRLMAFETFVIQPADWYPLSILYTIFDFFFPGIAASFVYLNG